MRKFKCSDFVRVSSWNFLVAFLCNLRLKEKTRSEQCLFRCYEIWCLRYLDSCFSECDAVCKPVKSGFEVLWLKKAVLRWKLRIVFVKISRNCDACSKKQLTESKTITDVPVLELNLDWQLHSHCVVKVICSNFKQPFQNFLHIKITVIIVTVCKQKC